MDWKPEALTAAHNKLLGRAMSAETIRAALDAAVEAQGLDDAFNAGVVSTFEQRARDLEETYANARAEAFKEAAKAAESTKPYSFRDTSGRALTAKEIAAAIRALAKEPPK